MSRVSITLGLLVFAVAAPARAERSFDALAQGATAVATPAALAALFWAQAGTCAEGTELDKRQCEAVRQERRRQLAGKTFVVAGDAGALDAGDYDARKKSMPLAVRACFACKAALELGGQRLHVVGKGAVAVTGGAVAPEPMHRTTQVFAADDKAAAFTSKVLPRLRTDFVVRLPAALDDWEREGARGVRLEVLGFRVHDPCDGKVVAADPPAAALPAEPSACGAAEAVVAPSPTEVKPADPPPGPVKPVVPERLSTSQINQAMGPARLAAGKCYMSYGVPGRASFRITINSAGQVTGLEQTGDFVDTPTGTCIDKAVRATTFPAIAKDAMTFDYPFIVR